MTEELRNALQQAAGKGEPAVGDAFARFTAVKRRAAIARGAVVGVVGLAAVGILMLTLPGLGSGDSGGNLTGGDATQSPNVRAVKHYVDPEGRFELDYPAELVMTPNPLITTGFRRTARDNDFFEISSADSGPDNLLGARPETWDIYQQGCSDCELVIASLPQDETKGFYLQALVQPQERWSETDAAPYEAVGVSVARSKIVIDGVSVTREDWAYPKLPRFPRPGADPAGGISYWCHECTETIIVMRDFRPGEALVIRAVTGNAVARDYVDELDIVIGSIDLK